MGAKGDLTDMADKVDIFGVPPSDARIGDYLTIEQVAVRTGYSAKSIARMIRKGIIQIAADVPLFARNVIHISELAKVPKAKWTRTPPQPVRRVRRGP